MRPRFAALIALALGSAVSLSAQATPRRPLRATDIYLFKIVSDPQLLPDGA